MTTSRRLIAGLLRIGLVVLAIVFVSGYFMRRTPGLRHTPRTHMRVQTDVPAPEALGPGDLQIYNTDSSVDLILTGDKILAGLSPKTIAKIKSALDTSALKDTTGLGGSIAQIVKKSVAGAIGTHAVFPLSDIRDVRLDHDQIVFDWTDGGSHDVFGSTTVNKRKASNSFRPEDAERFIEAVRARKNER